MYANWPTVAQATTFPKPSNWRDDPNLTPRMKLKVEIERTSQRVYEANTDLDCDQIFLGAVNEIGRKCAKMRSEAIRMWGLKSTEFQIAEWLIDARQTHDLACALASWKAAERQS